MCYRSIFAFRHLFIKATSISRSWGCRIYNACREVYRWYPPHPPPPHCPPEDDFFSLPPYNKCCCPAFFRRSMRWSRAVISTSLPQRWSSWFYQRMGWDPGILKISEIHRALIRGLAKKNMMIWKSTGWDWLWLEWSQMDSNVAFVTLASFKVLESASDARTWSKGSWPWLTTSNSHRAQVVIL